MLAARQLPAWLIWLVVGTGVAISYPIQPFHGLAVLLGALLGVASCVLTVVGVRRHRPADPRAWLLVTAGQTLWVAGDLTYLTQARVAPVLPFPSVADAMYLCAAPLLALGLFRLSRAGWPRLSTAYV